MSSVTRLLTTKLKLRVNSEKSAVARPWKRKFLGFSFTNHNNSGSFGKYSQTLTGPRVMEFMLRHSF